MKLARAGLFFAALSAPANAAIYDGNRLVSMCISGTGFVQGYVGGQIDKGMEDVGIVSVQMAGDKRLHDVIFTIEAFCLPQGVVLGQAVDVFCRYLTENPAERHLPAPQLVSKSLSKAWPCTK
jgi:hypothetical protein